MSDEESGQDMVAARESHLAQAEISIPAQAILNMVDNPGRYGLMLVTGNVVVITEITEIYEQGWLDVKLAPVIPETPKDWDVAPPSQRNENAAHLIVAPGADLVAAIRTATIMAAFSFA